MKVLQLTDDQYNLLVNLALEERRQMREAHNEGLDADEILDDFNLLAEIFDLEKWEEQ